MPRGHTPSTRRHVCKVTMDQAQPLGLRGQAVHPAGVSEWAHVRQLRRRKDPWSPRSRPRLGHWASRGCQEEPCRGSKHAVWGGSRAAISPLCFLITKPSSISTGEHWTALIHRVSVTHEKKLGQFLMMLLITGFCSVLNEKKVTQAISLKVGPAHMRVCTHIHTTHTKEKKKKKNWCKKQAMSS